MGNETRPLGRRRTLIAALVFGGAMFGLLLGAVLWRGQAPSPAPAAVQTPPAARPAPVTLPLPPPMGRREIVDAASLAAAAYAGATAPEPRDSSQLLGRRFVLRIPFGCDGPQVSAGAAQAYFEIDRARGTVRLVARPGDWTALPLIPQSDGVEKSEAVEGFWLPRPWSFTERCPPRREMPVPAAPTPVAAPSLGLARVFEAGGSRLLRRDGRAYESVHKIADEPSPSTTAYRLVLEGRVVGFDDGRAIRCWSETPDHRPICLYGVEFDRIAFEDASGKQLSEWRE